MQTIQVRNLQIGPKQPLTIIAGPCIAESRDLCFHIARELRNCCADLHLNFIFKASFDKANRSSITGYRGPKTASCLTWFRQIRKEFNVPITTDIHESHQATLVAKSVDLLQIPAFLCRQTDLLIAAARTGKPVNVKKGQFLSPPEMKNVIQKLTQASKKSPSIILTERGTFFGYNRLVNDFIGLGQMLQFNYPVCFDVTHSTQQPAALGTSSGGQPQFAPLLAKAAIAAGVHALFIETHPDPSQAKSDAATMLPLSQTLSLLPDLATLYQTVRQLRS